MYAKRNRVNMNQIEYRWTNGKNEDFKKFYLITEEYYSKIVGGSKNRSSFVPYIMSESVTDVVIAYYNDIAIGCAGLKKYSDNDVEIKRVWVEPDYRENHIATMELSVLNNTSNYYKDVVLFGRIPYEGNKDVYRCKYCEEKCTERL